MPDLRRGRRRAPPPGRRMAAQAVCSAPAGVPFAAEAACEEGPAVEHGGVCTPACEAALRLRRLR
eukprot:1472219-Pyramimonas_sp.AAC.1